MTKTISKDNNVITLFTIGFTKKSAREFFEILHKAKVRRVVDIRLNNDSQLAGFAKKRDLPFFLETFGKIGYEHRPELAPTKRILDDYRKKQITWAEYEQLFAKLMTERNVENIFKPRKIDGACFLCSEPKADKCHRRLVAERFRTKWGKVNIQHL